MKRKVQTYTDSGLTTAGGAEIIGTEYKVSRLRDDRYVCDATGFNFRGEFGSFRYEFDHEPTQAECIGVHKDALLAAEEIEERKGLG